MQITNQTDRTFRRWMTVLDLDFIWDDARWSGARFVFPDQEAKEALAKLILERMATKTFDEWMTIFLAEGLAGDRFLTTQQALDDPQVRHNGSVVEVSDPELGPTLQLGMMATFSVSPGGSRGRHRGSTNTLGRSPRRRMTGRVRVRGKRQRVRRERRRKQVVARWPD